MDLTIQQFDGYYDNSSTVEQLNFRSTKFKKFQWNILKKNEKVSAAYIVYLTDCFVSHVLVIFIS